MESKNYLFVLANPGAGGHRLGRIISCCSNVYWYSAGRNGLNPWNIFKNERVAGKSVSEFHYDRYVGTTLVPLVGERIERYWETADIEFFYETVWNKLMSNTVFQDVLQDHILHWVLHDTPEKLLSRFPDAKIISIIDTDVEAVTDRYLETTANFPIFYRHFGLLPSYKTEYARIIEMLPQSATEKDLWSFLNPRKNSHHFYREILDQLNTANIKRQECIHKNHLTVTWDNLKIDKLAEFLLADDIDENYRNLIVYD